MNVNAQNTEYDLKKNGAYVEIFPINLADELGYFSVNYERIFGEKKRGSLRLGVYPNFKDFMSFPVTISQITHPQEMHHFEYGLGMAFSITKFNNKWWSEAPYFMVPLMYRYQKTEGLFFRGGINMTLGYGGLIPHSSVSVGYKF